MVGAAWGCRGSGTTLSTGMWDGRWASRVASPNTSISSVPQGQAELKEPKPRWGWDPCGGTTGSRRLGGAPVRTRPCPKAGRLPAPLIPPLGRSCLFSSGLERLQRGSSLDCAKRNYGPAALT